MSEDNLLGRYIRDYVMHALEATPVVLGRLLHGLADDDIIDARPDPERFTIREIMAHLADYEAVFLERIRATAHGDNPHLASPDRDAMVTEHDYAHADLTRSLVRFRERRAEHVNVLQGLSKEQWALSGLHPHIGPVSIERQVELFVGHDGYHTKQIVEWLEKE